MSGATEMVGPTIPFERLVHSDWSTTAGKRWLTEAHRTPGGWMVDKPRPVGSIQHFLDDVFDGPQPIVCGFDFPIGMPERYGHATGFNGYLEALSHFGEGRWSDFYRVAEKPEEISLARPFYPRVSSSAVRQVHLFDALEAGSMDDLRRRCERATSDRRAACSIFWTLGGNQVGKAAISGWQEVVAPARRRGALVWPFDGTLSELAEKGRPVIAETYPGDAYSHIGVRFAAGWSKRRQDDRRKATLGLANACETSAISLTPSMTAAIADGFGTSSDGEDRFDAAVGLFGMIEVVEGRRRERPPLEDEVLRWEGWILGQQR